MFLFLGATPHLGPRFLAVHTIKHIRSVGLLWTSDNLVAEASIYTQQTQGANIHAFSGIRTRDSRNRATADLGLRSQGQRNQQAP
jgi:hypothetical protein